MNGDKRVAPEKVVFIKKFFLAYCLFLYKVFNSHVVIVIGILFMGFVFVFVTFMLRKVSDSEFC